MIKILKAQYPGTSMRAKDNLEAVERPEMIASGNNVGDVGQALAQRRAASLGPALFEGKKNLGAIAQDVIRTSEKFFLGGSE